MIFSENRFTLFRIMLQARDLPLTLVGREVGKSEIGSLSPATRALLT